MKTIIRREFLDHIQSLQFMVLLVLSLALFAGNGLVFVRSYAARADAYQKNLAFMNSWKSTVRLQLYRSPNPLAFVADGGDSKRPSEYYLLPGGQTTAGPPNLRAFKLPAVPPLDWSFIIGVLFSLYAVLLGYNSVSGEREQGTLRLVLSNPLGRAKLLAAKYVSILFVLLIPLLAGLLVSLTMVVVSLPQLLTLAMVLRAGLVFIMALAYVSLFAFLSLLFSALIPRSALVLLVLLAVWVVLSVVVPSSSVILAEKLSTAPREIQTARMFEPMVDKEISAKIEEIVNKAERGGFKTEEDMRAAASQAFEEGQVKVNEFYDDFRRTQRRRLEAARNLSRLSPAALFQYAAEGVVRSGPGGEDQFLRQVLEYSRVYDAYVLKKLGKVVQSSNFSFGETVTFHGKKISLDSPVPREYEGDKSDFPVFSERQSSVGAGVKGALGDLAGLILWNILLAGLAFSVFLRTDVR
ncbi:MAG TPA: ABC transporter permease subunit [Terriglobales bacterium]|nr:ABC transporter permease subunit [Terriglobales bacterium]